MPTVLKYSLSSSLNPSSLEDETGAGADCNPLRDFSKVASAASNFATFVSNYFTLGSSFGAAGAFTEEALLVLDVPAIVFSLTSSISY